MRSSGKGLKQGRDEISQRVESEMNDASRRSHSRGSVWADECREMDGTLRTLWGHIIRPKRDKQGHSVVR